MHSSSQSLLLWKSKAPRLTWAHYTDFQNRSMLTFAGWRYLPLHPTNACFVGGEIMGIYSDIYCQVIISISEGWGRCERGEVFWTWAWAGWRQRLGVGALQSLSSAAKCRLVDAWSSFQQLSQDTAGPALSLLGLLMPPPVQAGVAGTYILQNAFKTRGYPAAKLQEPTAKLGSRAA